MNKFGKIDVERVVPAGKEGMYEATLGLKNAPGRTNDGGHGMCIKVVGKDLTECFRRVNVIIEGFESA